MSIDIIDARQTAAPAPFPPFGWCGRSAAIDQRFPNGWAAPISYACKTQPNTRVDTRTPTDKRDIGERPEQVDTLVDVDVGVTSSIQPVDVADSHPQPHPPPDHTNTITIDRDEKPININTSIDSKQSIELIDLSSEFDSNASASSTVLQVEVDSPDSPPLRHLTHESINAIVDDDQPSIRTPSPCVSLSSDDTDCILYDRSLLLSASCSCMNVTLAHEEVSVIEPGQFTSTIEPAINNNMTSTKHQHTAGGANTSSDCDLADEFDLFSYESDSLSTTPDSDSTWSMEEGRVASSDWHLDGECIDSLTCVLSPEPVPSPFVVSSSMEDLCVSSTSHPSAACRLIHPCLRTPAMKSIMQRSRIPPPSSSRLDHTDVEYGLARFEWSIGEVLFARRDLHPGVAIDFYDILELSWKKAYEGSEPSGERSENRTTLHVAYKLQRLRELKVASRQFSTVSPEAQLIYTLLDYQPNTIHIAAKHSVHPYECSYQPDLDVIGDAALEGNLSPIVTDSTVPSAHTIGHIANTHMRQQQHQHDPNEWSSTVECCTGFEDALYQLYGCVNMALPDLSDTPIPAPSPDTASGASTVELKHVDDVIATPSSSTTQPVRFHRCKSVQSFKSRQQQQQRPSSTSSSNSPSTLDLYSCQVNPDRDAKRSCQKKLKEKANGLVKSPRSSSSATDGPTKKVASTGDASRDIRPTPKHATTPQTKTGKQKKRRLDLNVRDKKADSDSHPGSSLPPSLSSFDDDATESEGDDGRPTHDPPNGAISPPTESSSNELVKSTNVGKKRKHSSSSSSSSSAPSSPISVATKSRCSKKQPDDDDNNTCTPKKARMSKKTNKKRKSKEISQSTSIIQAQGVSECDSWSAVDEFSQTQLTTNDTVGCIHTAKKVKLGDSEPSLPSIHSSLSDPNVMSSVSPSSPPPPASSAAVASSKKSTTFTLKRLTRPMQSRWGIKKNIRIVGATRKPIKEDESFNINERTNVMVQIVGTELSAIENSKRQESDEADDKKLDEKPHAVSITPVVPPPPPFPGVVASPPVRTAVISSSFDPSDSDVWLSALEVCGWNQPALQKRLNIIHQRLQPTLRKWMRYWEENKIPLPENWSHGYTIPANGTKASLARSRPKDNDKPETITNQDNNNINIDRTKIETGSTIDSSAISGVSSSSASCALSFRDTLSSSCSSRPPHSADCDVCDGDLRSLHADLTASSDESSLRIAIENLYLLTSLTPTQISVTITTSMPMPPVEESAHANDDGQTTHTIDEPNMTPSEETH